jgi:hypothetical protein
MLFERIWDRVANELVITRMPGFAHEYITHGISLSHVRALLVSQESLNKGLAAL